MKPISVRFRCFGPYMDEQEIRFDELVKYGLFLICGETGAGKTTILDAMCCALYGKCCSDTRGDMEAMRCNQASSGDSTEVEFIFESDGRLYRFYRKLTPRKSRKTDKGVTYNEEYSCAQKREGTWVALLDNPKKTSMDKKAEEIIGLNFNQFRQVILLPQGKFETFLTSNSEDKEIILSSIFHTERWDRAVERMGKEVDRRKKEIERTEDEINERLKRLHIASVGDLPGALEAVKKEVEDAEEAVQKAGAAKKQARDAYNDAVQQNELFTELERRQKKFDKAKEATDGDHELKARLQMAERAEKARQPYDAWKEAAEALKTAEDRLEETLRKLKAAEDALATAVADKQAHESKADEQKKRIADRERLSALRSRYQSISELQQQVDVARADMDSAKEHLEKMKEAEKREEDELGKRLEAWNAAQDHYREVSRSYQAASAGHLAEKLQEGQECPVCGNTHHIRLAVLAPDTATISDVKEAEEKIGQSREAYEYQKRIVEDARKKRNDEDQAYALVQAKHSRINGALQQELDQRDPELDSLEALDKRLDQLRQAIEAYDNATNGFTTALQDAQTKRDTLSGQKESEAQQLQTARGEHSEKQNAWQTALTETGLETETQFQTCLMSVESQQQSRITLANHAADLKAARDSLSEQETRVEGIQRPDLDALRQIADDKENEYNNAIERQVQIRQRLADLQDESTKLIQQDAEISEKRRKLESDTTFFKALRGSAGISLQRYVLGIRLSQVTEETNRLLANIYGGRFRLHRSNVSHGREHKSGLELEVDDNRNNQDRSVGTLSGGEKFLVALSLAIALSTVVQNEQKGVNLEAMFIDEGFGSLDQRRLGDAMDILQGVQRSHGLVGIISHVQLLEETIPAKLEILQTSRGSIIQPHLG